MEKPDMVLTANIPRCENCLEPAAVLHVCPYCGSLKCDACLTAEEIIADRCAECIGESTSERHRFEHDTDRALQEARPC